MSYRASTYPNVVDDQRRDAGDHPSIGLILCRGKNAVVAEHAPRGVTSPMGVADFRVTDRTDALPAELQGALPSLEAVRAELGAAPPAGVPTDDPQGDDTPAA